MAVPAEQAGRLDSEANRSTETRSEHRTLRHRGLHTRFAQRPVSPQVRREVALSFDVYPYQPGSTMANFLLPYDVWDEGPLAVIGKLKDPVIRARFAAGLEAYRLPLDKIRIVSGRSSPHKTIEIAGLEEAEVRRRLNDR